MRSTATAVLSLVAAFAGLTLSNAAVSAGGERCRSEGLAALARNCAGEDARRATDAIVQLRSAGQEGLDALCIEHDATMPDVREIPASTAGDTAQHPPNVDPRLARLRHAIDAVAKQRDAHASRLYWFTDLDEAKAEALASSKPILSLRLLGKLDEDLSCANSRFFRSVLYANAAISDYLREHFILHWESLRPVPKLSIDFGDGRRIERTITGNSIHYILDAHGTIVDALPGLYAPKPFLHHLQAAETALRQSRMMPDPLEAAELLRHFHAAAVVRIDNELRDDLRRIQFEPAQRQPLANLDANAPINGQPLAVPAAVIAPTKMKAEIKAVEAVIDLPGAIARTSSALDEAMWEKIAQLHANDAGFDERSVALIKSKMPAETAEQAQARTRAKRFVEDPVVMMLRTFQQSVAVDSVRNECLLHRAIHQWLAEAGAADARAAMLGNVPMFNHRVYAELFLTPLDDPWMGLAPRDAYAAVDGGGLIDACR